MVFNPKVQDFLDQHKDIKMIGFSWALYWRFGVLVMIIEAALFMLFIILGIIFGTRS